MAQQETEFDFFNNKKNEIKKLKSNNLATIIGAFIGLVFSGFFFVTFYSDKSFKITPEKNYSLDIPVTKINIPIKEIDSHNIRHISTVDFEKFYNHLKKQQTEYNQLIIQFTNQGLKESKVNGYRSDFYARGSVELYSYKYKYDSQIKQIKKVYIDSQENRTQFDDDIKIFNEYYNEYKKTGKVVLKPDVNSILLALSIVNHE